jgi:hypothetical protein
MEKIVSNNPLVRQLAEGQLKDNLFTLILNRELSFTDEEYLECLGLLMGNESLKAQAEAKILQIPSGVKETYLGKQEANTNLVEYLLRQALAGNDLALVTKVIHNQFLPPRLLELVAQKGDRLMLERLLDNQIKLIAFPNLITLIEGNEAADNFIRSRLLEIRSFYLDVQTPGAQISEEEATEAVTVLQEQHQVFVHSLPADEADEAVADVGTALTTLQRINQLSTAERIKLALTGSKTERTLLIRDPNKMVAMAVIESPKLGIDEVATLLRNRSVAWEIVSRIADCREWTKSYSICYELAINPKTPVSKAMGFTKKLRDADLRMISRDRNVTPLIRQVAKNVLDTKK